MTDTHSHIYDTAFDADRDAVVGRALAAGVDSIMMPAIDSESHEAMFDAAMRYPGVCLPMMGLHPTSVNDNPNYGRELELIAEYLGDPPVGRFYAVGEVGLDLYWNRGFLKEQTEVLVFQVELALKYGLPIVVHCRDAWSELLAVLAPFKGRGLHGVMHAFSGGYKEYITVRAIGDFAIGVGGPVTYKNSQLPELLPKVDPRHIVLETDAPYLPPIPYRGKRNESSYLSIICGKVAGILGIPSDEAAALTTANATRVFGIMGV